MGGLSGARCVGQHALFESLELADHMEAAAICRECPVIAACRSLARECINAAIYPGLVGTWAGQLHGRQGSPRPEIPTCAQCRSTGCGCARNGQKVQVRAANRTRVRGRITSAPEGAVNTASGADPTDSIAPNGGLR